MAMGWRPIGNLLAGAFAAFAWGGCADDGATSDHDNEVKVDTRSPEARRQYDANVAFASSYQPRCAALATSNRPRVLVTGFGRFMTIANNATGRVVHALVPSAPYPETEAPTPGEVDRPEPQLSVGSTVLHIGPDVGDVDVCAMILPVYWDMAAILIAKEAEAFRPSFVLMNGVAGPRQPLWIELGAVNRASRNFDGSNQLRPAMSEGDEYVKLIESAPSREDSQGNLLSWLAVRDEANAAVAAHSFDGILQGATLAGYPRLSNTYLCNNVTYVTGWLMSHPNKEIRLLRASRPVAGAANEVRLRLRSDLRDTPRVFVHWPSELADRSDLHAAGADVMRAIIGAQLRAISRGDRPTRGDNALADPSLRGGGFF